MAGLYRLLRLDFSFAGVPHQSYVWIPFDWDATFHIRAAEKYERGIENYFYDHGALKLEDVPLGLVVPNRPGE